MARLPQPGSDNGTWGDILNEFLSQSLAPSGELKPDSVGSNQLKENSVTNAAIAPNTITNTELASNAVNAAVIADGSITEALLDSTLQTKINQSSGVSSINAKTGIVTLDKTDVGLANVDNTSDAGKPVSTAQQTALDAKLDKMSGTQRVYIVNASGTQTSAQYSPTATASTFVTRDANGRIAAADPSASSDVSTKSYVDTQVGGKVTGPAIATDNSLPRFDGTSGNLIKNSNASVSDSGQLQLPAQGSIAGLLIGGDTNLYRFGADILSTDDRLIINAPSTGSSIALSVRSFSAGDSFDRFQINGNSYLSWGPGSIAPDTNLYRSAADTLKTDDSLQVTGNLSIGGTGTHPLSLTSTASSSGLVLYNTSDQTTNYERVRGYWSSNIFSIASEAGGTGVARNIRLNAGGRTFDVKSSASTTSGFIDVAIGTGSTGFVGLSLNTGTWTASSGVNPVVSITPNINQSSVAGYTAFLINPTETATGSGAKLLIDAQVGGSSKFSVSNTGVVQANGVNLITASSTDTLTNKTLTSPRIGTAIYDTNTNAIVAMNPIASAVNYFTVSNATTTNSPALLAVGADTNVGIYIRSKGTGGIVHADGSANPVLLVQPTASAVNYAIVRNSLTGTGPSVEATGTDTNIDLRLLAKGIGGIRFINDSLLPNGKAIVSYNTSDETTNYERVRQYWNGNNFTVIAEAGGTGTVRPIVLNGSSTQLALGGNGAQFTKSNTGASYVLNVTSAGLTASSGTQSGVLINPTINQTNTAGYTALLVNTTETAVGSGAKKLFDLQVGSSSKFSVDNTGIVTSTTNGNGGVSFTNTNVATTNVAETAYNYVTIANPTATSQAQVRSLNMSLQVPTSNSQTLSGTQYAGWFEVRYQGSGSASTLSAVRTGVILPAAAQNFGTISNATAVEIQAINEFASTPLTSGAVSNARGINIVAPGKTSSALVISNAIGIDIGPQAVATTNIGIRLAKSDTYTLQLSDTSGTAAGGITFGTDTNLYRSAANTLKTDDNLIVSLPGIVAGSVVTIDGTQTLTNKTFGDNLNMGSHRITLVTDPTSAQDAATKNYVDSLITTAPVAYNATGTGGNINSGSSLSWTHTASGTNRAVIVGVAVGTSGVSYAGYTRTCTYGGVVMTSLGAVNSGNTNNGFVELFYLLNPALGTQTVQFSLNTSVGEVTIIGNSVSYTGVGSIGAGVLTVNSNLLTSFTTNAVTSSIPNNYIVTAMTSGFSISSVNNNQRSIINWSGGTTSGNIAIADIANSTSATFTGTTTSNDYWGAVGVSLNPVQSLGGTYTDAIFTLQNSGDISKQLQFDLASISTGATRRLTVPNASMTLVGTDVNQTLTNKTLTNPKINQIQDTDGHDILGVYGIPNAVNKYYITNQSAGNWPTIGADGADANIGVTFAPKGNSSVRIFAPAGVTPVLDVGGPDANIDLNLKGQGSGIVKANGVPVATQVVTPPATATSTGVAGQIAYDSNYFYQCIAANTWKRSALSSW